MLFTFSCEIPFRLAGVNIVFHLVQAQKKVLPDGLPLKPDSEM